MPSLELSSLAVHCHPLSALLHHRQRPESPAHQRPATPAIPLTGHQRVSQPACVPINSRSTHTHNSPTINPSAGWFTPQPQSPDQPRQSQSTSLPQPGGLSQVHGLVACATPSRTDSTPLRHRSRVTYLSRAVRSAPGLVELSAQSPTPAKTNPLPPRRLTVSQSNLPGEHVIAL